MTIISMVVIVLYFAFSTGVRVWERDSSIENESVRLEAVLRLIEKDIAEIVPYNMNWEKGSVSLFAGGPSSMFYVTGNGTGSVSGAGAGLFFTLLYVDGCPDSDEDCLFLYKSSRPEPEFIEAVDEFRNYGEFQMEHYAPGSMIKDQSLSVISGVQSLKFSFSEDEFIPFAGTEHEVQDDLFSEEGTLSEEQWVKDVLPGQTRIVLSLDEKEYFVQGALGE